MKKQILLERDIKIRNVKKEWDNICRLQKKDSTGSLKIDMSQVETVDGAGLQMILFLLTLARDFPERFQIDAVSETLRKTASFFGFSMEQKEE